jgi:hypothetical protein
MTQLAGNAAFLTLRKDPRYPALLPVPADFVDSFVEPNKVVREWTSEAANDQFGIIDLTNDRKRLVRRDTRIGISVESENPRGADVVRRRLGPPENFEPP